MKNSIDEKTIEGLVPAAQVAGASEASQEFWGEVADHLAHAELRRSELVRPRRLTDAPKPGTV